MRKYRWAFVSLIVALLLECGLCQASFWSTCLAQGEDVTARTETVWRYVPAEEMETAAGGEENVYEEDGYLRVSGGALLLKIMDLEKDVKRLWLDLDIPAGYQIRATVFARDEGSCETYPLGAGRVLLREVEQNARMKIYPYGRVKNLYLRLETADASGAAMPGELGDLVCRIRGLWINGPVPFSFHPLRFFLWFCLAAFLTGLSAERAALPFEAVLARGTGRRRLLAGVLAFVLLSLALLFVFVQIDPACRKNLGPHHAQYQELARALAEGRTDLGEGDPRLMEAENPYDTVSLQAQQIPYRADYAWYGGKYYVYFGIVPELLLYLPYYLATGRDLQNYQAVFLFMAGFLTASAGLIYELMKRFFRKTPFFLYFVGVLMLAGGYSLFYLLIRPDLYHVPIAAACMFTAAGLWCWLSGLNRERGKAFRYLAGSLCMALTAGCRPQFLLFSLLAVPLFWDEVFHERTLFSAKGAGRTAALGLPFVLVAAGLMYYNAIRFGSPFDFGASYSLTSNDMTHRGWNLERVLYGWWYFLFQPAQLEGSFPWLRSARIDTDYLGRMVSESCFGGIFACSMLTWPLLLLPGMLRRREGAQGAPLAGLSLFLSAVICAVDATGAGILQRYSADLSFGIFFAAAICLFAAARRAMQTGLFRPFLVWLKAAVVLHLGFLFLILVNTDGSVNLLRGNPALYYGIGAALRW